jgi:hypothetical protein
MRLLVVGTGGVGSAFASIAARRSFFGHCALADYAADELFVEIDEVGVRDGANLVVEGHDFAPTFSI